MKLLAYSAFLISTLFTGIIQSSAATVAIVQALALSVGMSYKAAIPLVIGANIGTCMTALISSIGTSKSAKRVVAMHIYTNAIGGVVCMIIMYIVLAFMPDSLNGAVTIFGVAMIHSLFNILNTVAFIPFKKPLFKLCEKTVSKSEDEEHTVFLDERLFQNTPLAISECKRLVNEMAELSRTAVNNALSIFLSYDEKIAKEVAENEVKIDKYEDRLGTYLVKISANLLNEEDSHSVARMLHSLGDFERISDHALNICDLSLEIKEKKLAFSPDALSEIKNITDALSEIVQMSFDSFVNDDIKSASHVEPLEQVIDNLKDKLKLHHVDRLQKGECTTQLGFVFSDLLTNYERVSDHCSNLAVFTIQLNMANLEAHNYLSGVKSMDNPRFAKDYNFYLDKYKVKDN